MPEPSLRGALCGARTHGKAERAAHSSPHAGVLQSQAEIASFMEATLPQDKGDTLPASPIMDFKKGPEGLLYKDDVVGTGPSPTVGDELGLAPADGDGGPRLRLRRR